MTGQITVQVVDDSAMVRKMLTQLISTSNDIVVQHASADPILALRRMELKWPDVIITDIQMPNMSGLEFLKKVMSERPTPVIVCSSLTTSGSKEAIEASRLGAVEIIAKPQLTDGKEVNELGKKICDSVRAASKSNLKALKSSVSSAVAVSKTNGASTSLDVKPKYDTDAILKKNDFLGEQSSQRVIAIGASTGGTQALESILPQFPKTAPGILVVQHMPEVFTKAFSDRLDGVCDIDVKEAEDGDVIRPGLALIAPGGKHMMVKSTGSKLSVAIKDGPPVNRHKPSVDVLFRSVAKVFGGSSVGVILTGMGDDGARGLVEMKDAGAYTIGQDEETCIVYGMPCAAYKLGGVIKQVALNDVPVSIANYFNRARSA